MTRLGHTGALALMAAAAALPAEPSEAVADSYAEKMKPYVRTEPKIGRNEKCPCDSGKKFKKCHGSRVN